jgi:hypothetical protein
MTSQGTRPKPLSAVEVQKLVLEAICHESYSESHVTSWHARFDHPERMISIQDVLYGLEHKWRSCRPEKFNQAEWQWKYRIKTTNLDDERLTIIIALDPRHQRFEVVTRFYDRP